MYSVVITTMSVVQTGKERERERERERELTKFNSSSPFRETSNIEDGSMFCAGQLVISDLLDLYDL